MPRVLTLIALAATSLLLAVSPALAGGRNSNSISLVMASDASVLSTTASGPSYGDQVTFAVTTPSTDRPYVILDCYQGADWVYAASAGFWADYPGGQVFTLAAGSWPGGAADCKATVGVLNADGTKFRALASTTFSVDA